MSPIAYVTVPKDLTKTKSKMLFGLTKRQLVCFGLAALAGVLLFFLWRLTKFASLYEDEFAKAVIGHSQQADRKLKEKS